MSIGPKRASSSARKTPQHTKGVKFCAEKIMISNNFRLSRSDVSGTETVPTGKNASVARQTHCLAASYRTDKPDRPGFGEGYQLTKLSPAEHAGYLKPGSSRPKLAALSLKSRRNSHDVFTPT